MSLPKILWGAGFAANVAVLLILLAAWGHTPVKSVDPGFSYQDFVSICLTIVTVLIALIGVFLAVLAIFGYNILMAQACNAARDRAEKLFEERMERLALRGFLKARYGDGADLDYLEEHNGQDFSNAWNARPDADE